MLYEAGLRSARAIVQAHGFRISSHRGHVAAIDAADALTVGRHHRTFVRLHRMRRMRHDFAARNMAQPGTCLAAGRSRFGVIIRAADRRGPGGGHQAGPVAPKELIEAGQVTPAVDRYPLNETAQAIGQDPDGHDAPEPVKAP